MEFFNIEMSMPLSALVEKKEPIKDVLINRPTTVRKPGTTLTGPILK